MALRRWRPPSDLLALRRNLEDAFEDVFQLPTGWESFQNSRALDLYETDDAVKVEVEVPGMKPSEVDVTLTGNTLTIKGEREKKDEVKEENFHRREINYGAFSRSVVLPAGADTDKAEAKFQDGVLTITFPRLAEAKAKKIKVK